MSFESKKVLVIGAGKSGIGACDLLAKAKANIILYDSNEDLNIKDIKSKLDPGVEVLLVKGPFPEDLIKMIDFAVISPGVPTDLDYVRKIEKAGIPIMGEMELAFHFEKGELLAITGTNGKTTTTSLLGHIMKNWKDKVFVVGNIGIPYTKTAMETEYDSITVAEVSSFQLEKITSFHPSVSAILNITPDHLNRHHTMENYIDAKEGITRYQTEFDVCVLNYDDEVLREFGKDLSLIDGPSVVFFSSREKLEHGFFLDGEEIVYDDGIVKEVLINTNDLNLIGRHNFENVMAASAMAMSAGVPFEVIREALKTFHAVAHRIEFAGEVNGVRYYNDSKGTNPDAAIKAVEAMKWPTYLIAGGYDKDADYRDWIRSFNGKVKKMALVGATRENILAAAKECGFDSCVLCDTFEEAFNECAGTAKPGEAVLLSPACASWGMFDNYEQRGDVFKELVNKMRG